MNAVRTQGRDCGASKVFAIADHQVAHIYVNDHSLLAAARAAVEGIDGVARVLDAEGQRAEGLDHARSGDLVAFSAEDAWFTYYYWDDEAKAPDFARCVDIHRKCGYDPVELFLDPAIKFPKLKIGAKLLRKTLGFRMLMDVIPLDAMLVRGSHGRIPNDPQDWPLLIGDLGRVPPSGTLRAQEVFGQLYEHCARGQGYSGVAF